MNTKQSNETFNVSLTDKLCEHGYSVRSVEDCHFLGMPYLKVTFKNKTLTMTEIEKIVTLLQNLTKADANPIEGFWAIKFEDGALLLR